MTPARAAAAPRFRSSREFHPHHLPAQAHPVSRRLHVVGSSLALLLLVRALLTGRSGLARLALLQGCAFAWVGHLFIEHNRPATFRYPAYSLLGDWRPWWDVRRGRRKL